MSYRRQRLPRLHRVLNSKIYFFNKKNKLKKFKARKFRRKNKYVRKNFKTSFISNFFILSRRIKSRGLRNFNNSNFLFHRQFSKIIKYKNYLHNFILTKKHLFYRNKFRQFFNIKEKHLQFIRVHGKKSINKYSIHFINLKKFRNPFGFK